VSGSERVNRFYLFAHNRDPNLAPMWCTTMFEEKNSLPGSKLHFPIDDRDDLTRSRQNHADVRGHVIAAFRAMREVIGIFRHNPIKELLQVASCSRIGIFHEGYAATGVPNKDCDRPVAQTAFVDLSLDIVGDFVRSPAVRAHFELLLVNTHTICGTKIAPTENIVVR